MPFKSDDYSIAHTIIKLIIVRAAAVVGDGRCARNA